MKEMTSRERILAAMTGKEVDKVPVCPLLFVYLLDKYGSTAPETFIKFQQQFDYDIIYTKESSIPLSIEYATSELSHTKDAVCTTQTWMENKLTCIRREFRTPAGVVSDVTKIPPKGDRSYGISPNPFKTEWLIKERSDLDKLAYILPDPIKTCSTDSFTKTNSVIGNNGLTEMVIRSPVDNRAGCARGMENLMMDYYDDKGFFDEVLEFFAKYVMAETKFYLENGVNNIFGSWFYTSLSSGWSPNIFRECFILMMKKHVDLVHSYGAIYNLYDDERMNEVLEDYASTGTDVLQTLTPLPVGDLDLTEAKKRIGDKVCLYGHTDLIYTLFLGSVSEVEDSVRNAILTAGPGGRFILGTSDSIRDGTPEENVEAYFRTANKYRNYPIII